MELVADPVDKDKICTYVKFNQTNYWSGKFTCIWKTVMKNFVFSMAAGHRDFFQNIWEFCLGLKISLSIGFFDLVDICWNNGTNQHNNEDWDGCYWKLQNCLMNEFWHNKQTKNKQDLKDLFQLVKKIAISELVPVNFIIWFQLTFGCRKL